MGSGTTAVEAQLAGRAVSGVELDPFARLVSDVRSRQYSPKQISNIERIFESISSDFHIQTVDYRLEPRLENIHYWFNEPQFTDLLKLKSAIHRLSQERTPERDFFSIVLADLVRPCSKAERQTLKPYISKKYEKTPADVLLTFRKVFDQYFNSVIEFENVAPRDRTGEIEWIGQDTRKFEGDQNSIDVAITSPPYINALDYVRCIKLESAWVGTGTDDTLSSIKKSHIGENVSAHMNAPGVLREHANELSLIGDADARRLLVVRAYFADMAANLRAVRRCLQPRGMYYMIVGNSVIRGVPIETHQWLAEIAEAEGYQWTRYFKYMIKDHRTSIPRRGNGGKIHYEHVIGLRVD